MDENKKVFYKFILIVAAMLACTSARVSPSVAWAAADDQPVRIHFQDVIEKAKGVSTRPFQAPGQNLSESLKKIGYDQWRDIRFKPSQSLWREGPGAFQVQFFHPGFIYQQPVTIHYIDRKGTHHIPFAADLFDYTKNAVQEKPSGDLGFAGFRIHYPINTSQYADEIVSFLGASYFRALGKGQSYGMSARGLAINTVEDVGEEFPLFTEFWIVQPRAEAKEIVIYALLDSPSLAGAYEFVIRPGEETVVGVKSVLFIRKKVRKLGIAPLTSMFFFGENSGLKGESDFRPEVHDSDGLLMQLRSGEWVWHPLVAPAQLLVNSFGGGQPLGFGLIQRDTAFDHYQDLEARYDRRPGVWVVPQGEWGKGHLELIQIPTSNEYNDNIGAYWVPERTPEPGEVVHYNYTLMWHFAGQRPLPQSYVTATRVVKKKDGVMFVIDFSGKLAGTVVPGKEVMPDIQIFNGYKVERAQVIRNTAIGGWRLVIEVKVDQTGIFQGMLPYQPPAIDLRAFLKDGDVPVTETWSYTYLP